MRICECLADRSWAERDCQTEHRARLEKATARCFIWSFHRVLALSSLGFFGLCGHRLNPFCCGCWARLAERSKRSTDLFGEELRLFPRRKVPAFLDLVVMDEFGIRPLCPTPRGLILLARKDAHGYRNGDALGVEKAAFIFPVETRRRDSRVRQPITRDVVEELVTREFARGARGPVQSRGDRRGRLAFSIIVVEKPGGQADGESAMPYNVCGRDAMYLA